jgi:hypothetical protein
MKISHLYPLLILVAAPTWASPRSPDQAEVARLKARAEATTRAIGELASSGKLPQNDESVRLLQQMVDELREIRASLAKLEQRQDASEKTSQAQQRSLSALERVRLGGYTQFQYQDTDRAGGAFDAFRLRRVRLAFESSVSPRVAGRVTVELASGTNQTQAQLRDAWISYDLSGSSRLGTDRAILGQQNMPLGYEIERSSAERELPERSQYNQVLFAGERSRGVRAVHSGRDGSLHLGAVNSLTINDPEQANQAPGPGDRLAVVGGARFKGDNYHVGLSGLVGERAAYTSGTPAVTSPKVPRRFVYLDGELRGFLAPRLTLRGEVMHGRDRLPNATAAANRTETDMAGFHVLGVYSLSSLDQVALRWEQFDPDLDRGTNALNGYGIAYLREIAPRTRLTLAYEVFTDESRQAVRQVRYGQTTLRLQLRF